MIGESKYHRTRSFWKRLWHNIADAWQDRHKRGPLWRVMIGGAIR